MANNDSIVAAIYAPSFRGHQLLEVNWPGFQQTLRRFLQQEAAEDQESSDELQLFFFHHPATAVAAINTCINKAKDAYNWRDANGLLPLHTIIYSEKKGETQPSVRNCHSHLWDFVQPEKFYLTRSLRNQWDFFLSGGDVLPHTLHEEANGLFRLEFVGPHQASSHKLFPLEQVSGSIHRNECFYCGMTSHKPATCPSKYLDVEIDAISEVGHLGVSEITDTFKKVFLDPQKVISALAAGVVSCEIRKNQEILVYVAYLDLFRIFQLRFLMTLCFFSETLLVSSSQIKPRRLDRGSRSFCWI